MKRILLHSSVAILTFIIGVSIAAIILMRPNSRGSDISSLESAQKRLDDLYAWQIIVSFANRDLTTIDEKSKA
jgi:hypothetical protein